MTSTVTLSDGYAEAAPPHQRGGAADLLAPPGLSAPDALDRPTLPREDEGVGYLLKYVVQSVACESDRRLCGFDLTIAQCAPLFRLRKMGMATVGDLARALAADAGSTTRLLDRLESKRLIRRLRASPDRRVVHIELTEQGEAVIGDARVVVDHVLDGHLTGFTAAEVLQFKAYLARMARAGDDMHKAWREPEPEGPVAQSGGLL